MGRKRKKTDLISVVEACYRQEGDDRAWLSQLLEVAHPVLDQGGGLGLSLVKEEHATRSVALSDGVGALRDMLRLSWPVIERLDQPTYRAFFYPGVPVVLASSLVSGFAAPAQDAFASLMGHAGATDLLGMLGYPAHGWSFALFLAVQKAPLSSALKTSLRRIRIHVETSVRLRVVPPSAAVAIIHPDGRLAHVQGAALERVSTNHLRAQAAAIERARSSKERQDPHRALAVWRALVQGRWSVVERQDRDGRRMYYAFENAPQLRHERELTPNASRVVAAAVRGENDKDIAYDLGISQSRVSSLLAEAATRLGFAGRSDMVRVGARLKGQEFRRVLDSLTPAERETLESAQRGLTNGEIAAARAVSTHTIAAQLRSLRRKLGGISRRGLLLLDV